VRPSPALLQSLARSRLLVRRAKATIGVGERRSQAKGSGMEFLDYRPYEPGDDLRYLDTHVFARTGAYFSRRHALYQQLPITIIVDGSASMNFGLPTKFDFARELASALAFVGLAGGDAVQAAVFAGERLHWLPWMRGTQRAPLIFNWFDRHRPYGSGFGRGLADALPRIGHRGLVILISDWWLDQDVRSMSWPGGEIVAVQVVTHEELDPARHGVGRTRLVDAESGHEVELSIDGGVLHAYTAALRNWQEHLRAQMSYRHGRYFLVPADTKLEQLLLRDWRRVGFIQ
jgi:uncharacterized protein (DUF58 family)